MFFFTLVVFTLSSCYVHTTVVGDGVQEGIDVKAKQHNFLFGLVSGETPDTYEMAKGAKNYVVTTKHTFVDGLINALTSGIYTPTTVVVER